MEACLKFARRYWHTRGETARTKFVAFTHAFHGRTMGSLSVTWDEHYRDAVRAADPGRHVRCRPTDPAALDAIVDDDTAAIIVEPIQGEGGVRPVSRALARRDHGGLPAHGRAADRRRSAERMRPHRHVSLQRPDRTGAGSGRARQGARRRRAGRRRDGLASASRRRFPPAITAPPTAGICWRAGRR